MSTVRLKEKMTMAKVSQKGKLPSGAEVASTAIRKKAPASQEYPAVAARLQHFLQLQVGAAMKKVVVPVQPGTTVRELEVLFEQHGFNSFPVVKQKKVIGIVTKFDFLKNFIFTSNSIIPHYEELMNRKVESIMTREVIFVHPDTPLPRALQLMVELKSKSLPVVDDHYQLQGMISRGDIIQTLKG
jgi:CBS domain-containing protein